MWDFDNVCGITISKWSLSSFDTLRLPQIPSINCLKFGGTGCCRCGCLCFVRTLQHHRSFFLLLTSLLGFGGGLYIARREHFYLFFITQLVLPVFSPLRLHCNFLSSFQQTKAASRLRWLGYTLCCICPVGFIPRFNTFLTGRGLVLDIVFCTKQSSIQNCVVGASLLVVLSSKRSLGSSRQCESLVRTWR